MICSVCQSTLPSGDAVLCEQCDLYHVVRYIWKSLDNFLTFLNGKKFIYHCLSIETNRAENSRLREFSAAIKISPDVIELKLASFKNPEDLVFVADLMEKLPNCSSVQLRDLTITDKTAPYLSKIMAFPQIHALVMVLVSFTFDACQIFAESMDPDRFSILSFHECNIPKPIPIINALVNANISTIPSFINRQLTKKEFSALSNFVQHNERINNIYVRELSNKQSRKMVESLIKNISMTNKKVAFSNCDLDMAIPTIAELLCSSQSIVSFEVNDCNMTLALLTELCDGLKNRKNNGSDLTLAITDRNYTDSLQPIVKLLEDNLSPPGLLIATSSSGQEWISIIKSLKNNTTLKRLNITLYRKEGAEYISSILTDSLKVNNTLRSLVMNTRLLVPMLDPLVKTVITQNKLESFHISHGGLRELRDFKTLCSMLKTNWKLKEFSLGSNEQAEDKRQNIKIFQETMKQNFSLLQCDIIENASSYFKPYKERNIKYQEQWKDIKQDIIIVIHNFARNVERTKLPIDIWLEIFKQLKYPLMPSNGFEDIANKIFSQYYSNG